MAAFDILLFLEHYHQFPCLWDKSLPDFKNRHKRDYAESALLEISGLGNVKALRAKIRSIRGTYNNEFRKIRKSNLRGSGADDVYKPKLHWFYYADSFLRKNYEDEPDSESNLQTVSTYDEPKEVNDYFPPNMKVEIEESFHPEKGDEPDDYRIDSDEVHNSAEPPTNQTDVPITADKSFTSPTPKKKTTEKPAEDPRIEEFYKFMKSVQENKRDEINVFGELVSYRLRSIRDARARLITQHRINNILFEAEMAQYPASESRSSSVTPYTMVPTLALPNTIRCTETDPLGPHSTSSHERLNEYSDNSEVLTRV